MSDSDDLDDFFTRAPLPPPAAVSRTKSSTTKSKSRKQTGSGAASSTTRGTSDLSSSYTNGGDKEQSTRGTTRSSVIREGSDPFSPGSSPPATPPAPLTDSQMHQGNETLLRMAQKVGFVPAAKVLALAGADARAGVVASGSGLKRGAQVIAESEEEARLPFLKSAQRAIKSRENVPTPAKKSKDKVASISPSSSPAKAPYDPKKSFWGAPAAKLVPPGAKQVPVGEASRKLAALAAKRPANQKVLDIDDDDDDDDIEADDEGGSARKVRYVSTEAGAKQRKAAQLVVLKAKRQGKAVTAIPKNPFEASKLNKPGQDMTRCACCEKLVPSADLEVHSEICFAEQSAATMAQMAGDNIIHSSPVPEGTRATGGSKKKLQLLTELAFSSPPAPRHPAKGKGRALIVDDDEEEEEYEHPEEEPEEGDDIYQIDDDDDDEWEQGINYSRGDQDTGRSHPKYINDDGNESSPAKNSIFISSMSKTLRLGYDLLYPATTVKEGYDLDPPQKRMAKKVYAPKRGGRGRGRGGSRRGKAASTRGARRK